MVGHAHPTLIFMVLSVAKAHECLILKLRLENKKYKVLIYT